MYATEEKSAHLAKGVSMAAVAAAKSAKFSGCDDILGKPPLICPSIFSPAQSGAEKTAACTLGNSTLGKLAPDRSWLLVGYALLCTRPSFGPEECVLGFDSRVRVGGKS